jgi:hypothetical protein
VLAVVSLPVAAFMHYGTSVKASVVFVRKLDSDEVSDPDAPVFLAEAARRLLSNSGGSPGAGRIRVLGGDRKYWGDAGQVGGGSGVVG